MITGHVSKGLRQWKEGTKSSSGRWSDIQLLPQEQCSPRFSKGKSEDTKIRYKEITDGSDQYPLMRHLSMPWGFIDQICWHFPCCQHWNCSIVGSSVNSWLSGPRLSGHGSLVPSFYAHQLAPAWVWEAWVRHPSKGRVKPTLLYELKRKILATFWPK